MKLDANSSYVVVVSEAKKPAALIENNQNSDPGLGFYTFILFNSRLRQLHVSSLNSYMLSFRCLLIEPKKGHSLLFTASNNSRSYWHFVRNDRLHLVASMENHAALVPQSIAVMPLCITSSLDHKSLLLSGQYAPSYGGLSHCAFFAKISIPL